MLRLTQLVALRLVGAVVTSTLDRWLWLRDSTPPIYHFNNSSRETLYVKDGIRSKMLDEAALRTVMTDIGYSRLKRHVYRAEWSTPDVEHLMYFLLYGTPKDFLTVDFGLKNLEAEIFAIKEIKKYGGVLYQVLRYDERIDTFMRFSLGTLASWGLRASIRISGMTGAELAKTIRGDIDEKLLPIIRGVRTLNDLLSVLLLDVEPFPWVRCNGAIRAGEVVYLAR